MVQSPPMPRKPYKIPESVLVVIHTADLNVLLIRRADVEAEYWQSITGSKDFEGEALATTALREVREETGLDGAQPGFALRDWQLQNVYDIYPRWRWRYAPGVTRNVEHVFGLRVPAGVAVRLNPREHTQQVWLPWRAAADRCYSPSNAEACLLLPRFAGELVP